MEAGRAFGIRPFGVEAQRLLRREKGHVIIGQDTDGLTTLFEANMASAVPKTKREYRDKAGVESRGARDSDRLLTGFRLGDAQPPPENCLIVDGNANIGRVASASLSKACGGVIGPTFLPPEKNVPGLGIAIQ